jgi:WD40-like Beta Propeller Repeat
MYTYVPTNDESNPQFSKDGHWIAYNSNESGRHEVYITSFPDPGRKWRVSAAGGTSPRWRGDGKEIFYLAPDNRLTAAALDLKPGTVEVKNVELLFGPLDAGYDVSADGQRFLAPLTPEGEVHEPLTVVLNWTAGLKKKRRQLNNRKRMRPVVEFVAVKSFEVTELISNCAVSAECSPRLSERRSGCHERNTHESTQDWSPIRMCGRN